MTDFITSDLATKSALEMVADPALIQTVYFSILLIMAWSMVWKGIAMWIAARNNSKPWFIALLVINTVGILEILYIFVFSKKNKKAETKTEVGKEIAQTKEEILKEVRSKETSNEVIGN